MHAQPMFPAAGLGRGMYESFYLRAVSPEQPLGLWIRHTVHKRPGTPPRGSVWCTVFDAERPAPLMSKETSPLLAAPGGGWIEVGERAAMGPGWARGECGELRWSLQLAELDSELRHLHPGWLYRAPLPRTKLTSPAPLARVDGALELPGGETVTLQGWPGMVGHNWGSEHAARWIWLHAAGFAGEPDGWLDVALARVALAGRLTPWLASGALSLGGRRRRLGGVGRRPRVREGAEGCSVELGGEGGVTLALRALVPSGTAAGWRYADPAGGGRDVVNCSIAQLELTVSEPASDAPLRLRSEHAGAYELGMRSPGGDPSRADGQAGGHVEGVAIAPFPDG